MKVFAKFDEIPSMILEVIKETKRYGHTFGRTVVRSFGRSDNVKTVYPPTNTVCGGYNKASLHLSDTVIILETVFFHLHSNVSLFLALTVVSFEFL